MADISQYLKAIQVAKYGEEVRGSICRALEAMNEIPTIVEESAIDAKNAAIEAQNEAAGFSEEARIYRDSTIDVQNSVESSIADMNNSMSIALSTMESYLTELYETVPLDELLKKQVVAKLPTLNSQLFYDFEDENSKFVGVHKSTVDVLLDGDKKYQRIISTSGNIGSSENCKAILDLRNEDLDDISRITIEFDLNMVTNGRWHISLCDLDVREKLDTIRYIDTGVAIDIASNKNYELDVNASRYTSQQSLFNSWVHCKFEINMETNSSSRTTFTLSKDGVECISGTHSFKDSNVKKINGIELYTWTQNDEIYFDNIRITASRSLEKIERSLYILKQTNSESIKYSAYIYVDGNLVKIGDMGNIYDMTMTMSPEQHRVLFRGKNLGSTVTDEQKAAIKDGTFKDLFLGDYWVINGINWRIVDMDYFYNDEIYRFFGEELLHHLVIMPDTSLYEDDMNSEDITTGGYAGSEMHTTNLARARTTIYGIFEGLVFTHFENFSNAVTDGVVTGADWIACEVELPSEIMMYGTNVLSSTNISTLCTTQLALFGVAPRFIASSSTVYWLRDVFDSRGFAVVGPFGEADWSGATDSLGVRPYFCIG